MNPLDTNLPPAGGAPELPPGLPVPELPVQAEQSVQAEPAPPCAEDVPPALAVSPPATPPTAPEPAPPAPLPQTLDAAREAAAFVARIFAETATEETPVAPTAEQERGALPDAAPEEQPAPAWAPVPQGWPQQERPLQGQKVLVLGLGASGLAMARWCVRCGAEVTVADTRDAPPQLAALQAELPQVRCVAGPFAASLVQVGETTAVYCSPGLAPHHVAPVLEAARAHEISVGGELDLYFSALVALRAAHGYTPAVLAITGTNGKTTVTSLTGKLVAQAGRSVAVAGNIGPTLLDTLAQHIDAAALPQVWVLELSSFQLDGVQGFEPTAAAVLNLTQDHLDWHGSMAAYARAKARIFGRTALMVLNRDDPQVMDMLPPPEGGRGRFQKPQLRAHTTFGASLPERPGDFGMEVVNGMAWLVRAQEADETQRRKPGVQEELFIQRLMPADALRIRGRHNATNALAALALAQAAGCPLSAMLYALREYRGEPHRVEPVGMVHGVEFFDDSKGTNVGATVAALHGLGADRRLVVILGGDGKGQDFAPLASPVALYARAVVLIGRDAPPLRAALQDCGVPLHDAPSLPEAVRWAQEQAQPGDAVLLSPACASLDMFRDYAHRAQVFIDTVRDLALDAGTDLEAQA